MTKIHDDGASYRGLAQDLECSRRALSTVYSDTERRRWYLERDADDERVQQAVDELAELQTDSTHTQF